MAQVADGRDEIVSLVDLGPYDARRVERTGDRAVVIGASMSGLLAARVLADAFDEVLVLDRDPLDGGTRPRRGVPQGRHIHVLLPAGLRAMEELCPGVGDDLLGAGAVERDFSRDLRLHAAGDFVAPGTGGMPLYYATRPLIESVLRRRVAGHDRVTLRPGCQVVGPLTTGADGVGGVEVVRDGGEEPIRADLVVDTAGRASRTAGWLEELGYPTPSTESVHVDLAYRTCVVERPSDDRRAILVLPSPSGARGAAVAPVEDDRWVVTLFGMHGDHPPDDREGLLDFAASLPTQEPRRLLEEHEPVTPGIARYRFPSSTRHRYDQLDRHAPGVLALGDAVASFNPIYGQGMTIAAFEALALHRTLAEGTTELGARFHRRARAIVEEAWRISAGSDFQFPQTEGPEPPGARVVNRYIARLHRRAHRDGRLSDAFNRVAALEAPATSLFRPATAWRVLGPRRSFSSPERGS